MNILLLSTVVEFFIYLIFKTVIFLFLPVNIWIEATLGKSGNYQNGVQCLPVGRREI